MILLTCISKRLYPSYVSQEYWRRSLEWLSCTCFYHRWLDRTFSSLGRGTGNRSRLFHTRLVLSDKCFSTQSDQNHCCLYLQICNHHNQSLKKLTIEIYWFDTNFELKLDPWFTKQFTSLGLKSLRKLAGFQKFGVSQSCKCHIIFNICESADESADSLIMI